VNPVDIIGMGLIGFIFTLVFLGLILYFMLQGRKGTRPTFREIPAFARLGRGIGRAVEAGQRLHVGLGVGGMLGQRSAAGLVGLSILQRVARAASISDRPPVATSGEGATAVLSQDTLRSAYRAANADSQYDPSAGQLAGATPFSYAAGVLPVVFDQQVSVNILTGSYGSEVALITDAAERTGGSSLGGSDNLAGQAVLYASAQDPLIGEELYAAGAYIQAGLAHQASVQAQDVLRWVLIGLILLGALLKMAGVL
jgi:hypothetical protein